MLKVLKTILCLVLTLMAIVPVLSIGIPFSEKNRRVQSWVLGGFGKFALPLGDLDSDGYDDFLISDPLDDLIQDDGGAVYIFYGGPGFDYTMVSKSGSYVSFHGFEPGGRVGEEVVAGDFNGDNRTDILLGMRVPSKENVDIYLIDGKDLHPHLPGRQFSLEVENHVDTIPLDNKYGYQIKDIGDFNGDGVSDYAVGAPGALFGRGRVQLLLSREGKQDLTYDYTFTGGVNERLGAYISKAGDLDGDCRNEFIMGNSTGLKVVFYNVTTSYENLWDNDGDGIVDFTGWVNMTGNTFGILGSDDGWDTATPPGPYGGDETSVRYMPNETESATGVNRTVEKLNMIAMEIGGKSPVGGEASGAFGVEFNVNQTELKGLISAMVDFDYTWWDYGFESDERWWIKGRISSFATTNYLGFDLDEDGGGDITKEIFTLRDNINSDQWGRGHFSEETVGLFPAPGDYYIDLGGKITKWTTQDEYLALGFDNISLRYTNLNPIVIPIIYPWGWYYGNFSSTSGDVNGDSDDDLIIMTSHDETDVILGGNISFRSLQEINLSTINPYSKIISSSTIKMGLSGCVVPSEGYFKHPLLIIGAPQSSLYGLSESGVVLGFDCMDLTNVVNAGDSDYILLGDTSNERLGRRIFPLGDIDGDLYTDIMTVSDVIPGNSSVVISLFSREPLAPDLLFTSPKTGEILSKNYTFRLALYDPDKDISGENLSLYASKNNITFTQIGNTTVMGNGEYGIEINTKELDNGNWFFKANITDRYGHKVDAYTGEVRVFNPHTPNIKILYPFGGETLRGIINIRVLAESPDGSFLNPGVSAYISPDGDNWTLIGSTNESSIINPELYIIPFDTTDVDDGKYFFKSIATNIFNLTGEDVTPGNITIDNAYPPKVHILYPTPNLELSGISFIRLSVYDRDENFVSEGVTAYLGNNFTYWQPINFSSNTYNGLVFEGYYNTSDFANGIYSLRIDASDVNGTTSVAFLNGTVHIINTFSPVIKIVFPLSNATLGGLVSLRAEVTDTDNNVLPTTMHYYASQDGTTWIDLGMGILYKGFYRLDYNFTSLNNGYYYLKAIIKDGSNNTAQDVIRVVVLNHYPPEVVVLYPNGAQDKPLKGEVEVKVLVTDDGPLDMVTVTIFLQGPNGNDVPLGEAHRQDNTSIFILAWNTKESPDGLYYLIKAVAKDSDGLTGEDLSNSTFQISNRETVVPGGGEEGFWKSLGASGQLLLVVGILFLVSVVISSIFYIKKKRREKIEQRLEEIREQKEKKRAEVPAGEEAPEVLRKVREELERMPITPSPTEEEKSAYKRDLEKGFETEEEYIEETPFMVKREEEKKEEEEDFFWEEKPKPKKKKVSPEVPIWDLVPVEDKVIWEEKEEEEDYFYVKCKCGYDIPIPVDYKPPYRFRCPKCGRTGVIRE